MIREFEDGRLSSRCKIALERGFILFFHAEVIHIYFLHTLSLTISFTGGVGKKTYVSIYMSQDSPIDDVGCVGIEISKSRRSLDSEHYSFGKYLPYVPLL